MSLFERLGGAPAVEAAVDRFCDRVQTDERIRHFFAGSDIAHLRERQKAFLTYTFGGAMVCGAPLVSGMGLDESHYDAVVENLAATLVELGVSNELIGEVALVAESVKHDVLGH